MQRLALGVAALLVVSAGSVATAAPSGEAEERDWCERNSDASATPEVEKERPVTAGGGRRNGNVPNAFTCYRTAGRAGDHEVSGGAVVNAWVDHEHGVLRVNCVPDGESRLSRRCNQIVVLPAAADAATPSVDVTGGPESGPPRAEVDGSGEEGEPTATVEVADTSVSVDVGRLCVEVDRSPICRENPENPEGE